VWLQGDNTRNSNDSRHYGAVPVALLRGRVCFRVWPLREAGRIAAEPHRCCVLSSAGAAGALPPPPRHAPSPLPECASGGAAASAAPLGPWAAALEATPTGGGGAARATER
jgi:hypothetical protein